MDKRTFTPLWVGRVRQMLGVLARGLTVVAGRMESLEVARLRVPKEALELLLPGLQRQATILRPFLTEVKAFLAALRNRTRLPILWVEAGLDTALRDERGAAKVLAET